MNSYLIETQYKRLQEGLVWTSELFLIVIVALSIVMLVLGATQAILISTLVLSIIALCMILIIGLIYSNYSLIYTIKQVKNSKGVKIIKM